MTKLIMVFDHHDAEDEAVAAFAVRRDERGVTAREAQPARGPDSAGGR